MNRLVSILLVVLLCTAGFFASSQRTSRQVKRQRTATEQKIARTRSQLNRNAEETRRELLNLQSIEADIAVREAETKRLKTRIAELNGQERRLNDTIRINEEQMEKLRVSYAKAVRAARRQRSLASKAAFIFSSKSFEQARSRTRYLRELRAWQLEKSDKLKDLNATLAMQKESLANLRAHTAASIDSVARVQAELEESRDRAGDIVSSLKRQKKNLDKVLAQQIEQSRKLDDELSRIIEEEARAEREARHRAEIEAQQKKKKKHSKTDEPSETPGKTQTQKPAKGKPETAIAATDELTAPFGQCKGKLPKPIDRQANIVSAFGRHAHSSLSKVQVQNNGVDFETTPGANACAVYPGVVSMVINMDGYHNVVMLRHGKYVTVYAGIGSLAVRKGQHVKAGQELGTIWSDPSDGNRTRLHFEIRHEKDKLDPAAWLK